VFSTKRAILQSDNNLFRKLSAATAALLWIVFTTVFAASSFGGERMALYADNIGSTLWPLVRSIPSVPVVDLDSMPKLAYSRVEQ
jgi:hypothetical protein